MSDDATLSNGLGEFLARGVPGEWRESRQGSHLECTLSHDDGDGETRGWPMARALAQYLLVYHERAWLNDLLAGRYRTFDNDETRRILDHVLRILHTDRDQDLERLDMATTAIFNYLASQTAVVVEGVRTFLLGDIRTEFQEAIDQAVDVHLMEQEYQEFVHLLRRLVHVAGPRQDWIHVRFLDNRFFFEDPQGTRLGDELIADMADGVDISLGGLDDVLISALVTLAPSRITVHQGQMTDEARDTLKDVFDGQVLFCHGCGRCYTSQVDRDRRSF